MQSFPSHLKSLLDPLQSSITLSIDQSLTLPKHVLPSSDAHHVRRIPQSLWHRRPQSLLPVRQIRELPYISCLQRTEACANASIQDSKVAVLGAGGGIGQPLSLLLKLNPRVSELALYDIKGAPGTIRRRLRRPSIIID